MMVSTGPMDTKQVPLQGAAAQALTHFLMQARKKDFILVSCLDTQTQEP